MNFHAKSVWKSFCSTFLRALTCAVTWRKGSRAKRTSVKPAVILLYVCTQQDDTSGFNFFFFSHLISHTFFSFSHTEVAGTVLSFISVVFSPFFSKFFDRNTQEASGLSPLLAVACLEGGQNDL